MSEDNILSLIGKDAVEQFDAAIEKVDLLGEKIKAVNDDIGNLKSVESSASTIKDLKEEIALQNQLEGLKKRLSEVEAELAKSYKEVEKSIKSKANASKEDEKAALEAAKSHKMSGDEYFKAKNNQDKATVRLTRSLKAQQRALDAENKALLKLQDPYEQMKATYRDSANHAKTLGAELFTLVQSGKASEEQIKKLTKEWRDANAAAIELHQGLSEIEQATGQSQRNVGNYNGLLVETNHILRELPNFAISARTGILSLSNNLPMFAGQFGKVSREIDDATGKAKGFGGAMKQLGRTILSWHTLLIVGITLAIQYAQEIEDFFTNLARGELVTSASTKAIRAYNEALKESLKETTSQIAELERLKVVLNDSEQSYSNKADALSNAKQSNEEYLGTMTLQNLELSEANKLIDQQIALIIKKASEQARVNAIALQAEKVAERELKYLEATQSTLSKIWGGESYHLSRLVKEKEVLATLTGLDLEANTKNLEILEEQHSEAVKVAKSYEHMLSFTKDISEFDANRLDAMYKQVDAIQDMIDKQKELIEGAKGESIIPLSNEDDTQRALRQSAVYRAKTDEERVAAQKELNETLKKMELDRLRDQYKYDEMQLAGHKQYQALKQEIIDKYDNMNLDKSAKSSRKRRSVAEKEVTGVLDYNQTMNKYWTSFHNAELANWQRIAKSEEASFTERMKALSKSIETKKELQSRATNDELNEVLRRIELGEAAEKKARDKRTDEEQSALLDLASLYVEEEILTMEKVNSLKEIEEDGNDAMLKMISDHQARLIKQAKETIDEVVQLSKNALNRELVALNEVYMSGDMSYRGYMRERRKILFKNSEEERLEIIKTYKTMISSSIMSIATGHLSVEETGAIKKSIKDMYVKIEEIMAGVAPRKPKSWSDVVFGEKFGDDDEGMDAVKKKVVEEIKNFFDSIATLIDDIREKRFREQFNMLDAEAEKIKENAEIEKNAIESSLLSQKDKAEKLEEIKTREAAFQAGIDEKRRRLERRKAISDKRAAIFKIGLDGAMAAASALVQHKFPYSLIIAGIIAATTAVSIAGVSAQQIPVYGDGTDNHGGGLAIVGDRGTEMVKTPRGETFLTPSSSTLMDLPKGTKVIPNHMLDSEHKKGLNTDAIHSYQSGDSNAMQALSMMFGGKIDELADAIVNKQETHFHWDNGELRKSVKRGNSWNRYVNDII